MLTKAKETARFWPSGLRNKPEKFFKHEQVIGQDKLIARRENWKKIAAHRGRWSVPVVAALSLPRVVIKPGHAVREIDWCDVGITECDALVAQTGSVLVTNQSAGGRVLSVLPSHHVVLARHDQLVPDLKTAFNVLRN